MAEPCEDVTSGEVVGRREGNGPVKDLKRNSLKGIGARRRCGGQGGELQGLYKPKAESCLMVIQLFPGVDMRRSAL